MPHAPNIIVVGAGIVGAAAAFHAVSRGARVTIVEADAPAAAASGASDGAVSVASKRPGPLMDIARRARAYYDQLVAEGTLPPSVFNHRPTYLFSRTAEEEALVAQHGRDLAMAGETIVPLARRELLVRIPGFGPAIRSGIAVPDDGHALGYQVVAEFLRRSDVRILRKTEVLGFELSSGRLRSVRTSAGRMAADAVIVAAGLGSGRLAGMQDVLLPRKGQLVITDRAADNRPAAEGHLMSAMYLAAKRRSTLDGLHIGLTIDPLRTGQFLIGGSRETGRFDRQTDAATIAAILREALDAYPGLSRQRVIRTFSGIRTAVSDGLPIVGLHPACPDLVLVTGFEGDGICLGPLMGSVAATLALGGRAEFDLSWLSPARFSLRDIAA